MKTNYSVLPSIIALSIVGVSAASAAVTYVENANIPIPITFGGVYLDLTANSTSSGTFTGAPDGNDTYTISYSEPAPANWDINLFFGGAGIAHNSTLNPYRDDSADKLSAIHNLGLGDAINGSTATPSGAVPLATASFGGSGTGAGGGSGVSTSENHMGTNAEQFQSGTQGYLAFVLDPGTPEQTYGWMLVTLNDNGSPGMIHEFALSDTPFSVGAIPEPGTGILGLLSLLAVLRRKRNSIY